MTEDRGTAERHDEDAGGRIPLESRSLPDPLLPEQPVDAERPVPLRAAPERTDDPDDWDVESVEPARGRPSPSVRRLRTGDGRDLGDESPAWVEPQSSYTTELQQGAVHPQESVDADADDDDADDEESESSSR